MKALLIADSDISVDSLARCIKPYGFDIIRYRSAIKALDNITEIEPDAVFISATDFPRHWKTISQFIRADTEKDKTIIVLLTNERFTDEDADKAMHIGIQAIIDENFRKTDDKERLAKIFGRYKPTAEPREPFIYEDIGERVVFLFTNPVNDTIITGKVEGISRTEIRFRPDAPSATSELVEGDILEQCSLKLDESVIMPRCRIVKNGNVLHLDFDKIREPEAAMLETFISKAI